MHRSSPVAVVLLALAALPVLGEAGAEAPPDVLEITADYVWAYNPPPVRDRRIDEHYESIIARRTGVAASWQDSALTGKSGPQLILEWVAAGTLPEVVFYRGLMQETSWLAPWIEQGLSRTWDAASVRRLLPEYAARLAKYGVSVEDVLAFNAYRGGNPYIPVEFTFSQFPKLATMPEAKTASQNYYAVGLRDDVLKRIHPQARSEAELLQVFAKSGRLTPKDITGDIPIANRDDLQRYLRAVKALNLKVGDKPLIPAALCATSESLGSIDWSLRTITGYHWQWPMIFLNPPGFAGSFVLRSSPEYGEYLRWWNALYNEGLLDPEIFVMKNDQYYTKVINGEYAVVNFWAPIADARRAGREKGWGYRFFPLFYGHMKDVFTNAVGYVSLQAAPLVITRKVSDADLPRVARWVDWYLGEEHDELAYWGTPDMYTGRGAARRYRTGFEDLEAWAVYGASGGRDGTWFGLQNAYPVTTQQRRLPLGGISFFAPNLTYPEAPYFVYPKDSARIARQADIWKIAADVIYRTVWDDYTLWTYANQPNNEIRNLPAMKGWDQYQADHAAEFSAVIVRMVTGPAADFDRNWAEYRRLWSEAGTEELERQAIAWMADYYRTTVLPKRIRK